MFVTHGLSVRKTKSGGLLATSMLHIFCELDSELFIPLKSSCFG